MKEDWYDPNSTKKQLQCLLNGCKPCSATAFCNEHDKVAGRAGPSVPDHCKECGEFIMDDQNRGGF